MISGALFVGIDRYQPRDEAAHDLGGCVGDMELMYSTMATVFSDLPGKSRKLTNEAATTSNLVGAIEDLVSGVGPGQAGFLYYAGHGGEVPNVDRTPDDPESHDQILVPHDFSKTEPVLDDMFHAWFSRIPEGGKLVAIFDSCHSGGMPRAPMSAEQIREYQAAGWRNRSIGPIPRHVYTDQDLQALANLKRACRIERADAAFVHLAASQDRELAWERNFGAERHGLFTYYLCEALRQWGAAATPRRLLSHATTRIQGHRSDQQPRLTGRQAFLHQALFDIG